MAEQKLREMAMVRVVGWVSEPPGVEIVADPSGAWLKVQGVVIFGLYSVPGQMLVVLDDARVVTRQEDGTMREDALDGRGARLAAENLCLDTNLGKVSVGQTFTAAWEEHLRMARDARAASPKLTLVPGVRG